MHTLVADVGGTNSRIALAADKGELIEQARFANDGFATFAELLHHYLSSRSLPKISACCIAIAGPVARDNARLTNRDWSFDPATIGAAFSAPLRRPVRLVNDLAALGHALGSLSGDSLRAIGTPANVGPGNGQSLVAGLGTGFNVCAVTGPDKNVVLEAEMGHASPPTPVTDALRAELGGAAAEFTRNEDLFSGPGLSCLHAALSGSQPLPGPEVIDRARDGDPVARRTADLAARLLGLQSRELVPVYLPLDGLFLAGSVARALCDVAQDSFLCSWQAPGGFAEIVSRVPVSVITDDGAALIGAARAARD